MEEYIVRLTNEYVQVGFARNMVIFIARYLPFFLVLGLIIYILYKLKPQFDGQIKKQTFFPLGLKLFANIFVFFYFVFWRYVFGIQKHPKMEGGMNIKNTYEYILDRAKEWGKQYISAIFLAFDTIVGALFTWIFVVFIKVLFKTPRPFVSIPEIHSLFQFGFLDSFPSGHSAIFFAIAVALYHYSKELGIVYGILAVLVGFARIASGVHYLSDVLFGFIIGYLVVRFIQRYFLRDIRVKYGIF